MLSQEDRVKREVRNTGKGAVCPSSLGLAWLAITALQSLYTDFTIAVSFCQERHNQNQFPLLPNLAPQLW